jgi:cytochrome c553
MKIALSTILAFMLLGCGEESQTQTHETQTQATPKESVAKVSHEVEKIAPQNPITKEIIKKVVKKVAPKKEEAEKSVTKAVEPVEKAVAEVASVDGKIIYKACLGCHGASADKPALGKSKIIKGWNVSKIEDALNGYKDGTYGGAMKGLMKAQASKLSSADIKAVSEYISKL